YGDEEVASLLSYVRRAWGNAATPVEPELAAAVRAEAAERTLPWRAEELALVAPETEAMVALRPSENGELSLPSSKATVFGQRLAYRPTLDVLAPWVVAEDIAEWQVEVAEAGTYDVAVNLAADDRS